MGAVDRFNSHLNIYLYRHRKSKWTKCCFFTIFQMALVNSWILMNKVNKKKIEFKEFLILFLKSYSQIDPPISKEISYTKQHLIQRIKKKEKYSRCLLCKLLKKPPK